jgi:hypothetical protein
VFEERQFVKDLSFPLKSPGKKLVPWGNRFHSDQGRVTFKFRAPSEILLPIAIVPAVV